MTINLQHNEKRITLLDIAFIQEDCIKSRARTAYIGTYQRLGLDAQDMEHSDC